VDVPVRIRIPILIWSKWSRLAYVCVKTCFKIFTKNTLITSVPDPNPDPDPPDPHVFGPPGSGSTSQIYGSGSGSCSGSGSFYNLAKIVRKTLIPTICYSF
jgi:hypothetical protein